MKEQILKMRSEGKTYNQIVNELGCSKGTVAYHCGNGVKNKTHNRVDKLRKIKRVILQTYVRRVKSYLGCIDCGIKDWRCLDFDHIDGNKSFSIGNATHSASISMKTLKLELRKCVVRCSNCHRIITYERSKLEEVRMDEELVLKTSGCKRFGGSIPFSSAICIEN